MTLTNGIDLDLLLEDQAHLTKRVAELEDNQETIVKFLRRSFPKKVNQLTRLLNEPDVKKSTKATSAFMQEDDGLSTDDAIMQCMMATPCSFDPALSKVGIESSREKFVVSDCLRG